MGIVSRRETLTRITYSVPASRSVQFALIYANVSSSINPVTPNEYARVIENKHGQMISRSAF